MSSCQCEGIEMMFDEESVRRELLFYERDGADDTTRWLIDAIKGRDIDGLSLLDIGGGLGAIQHDLLASGAVRATHVDGSSAYLEAAKRLARKRELEDHIQWRHGDFVEIAPELAPSDIVTLDRVICCYDDMRALVTASAGLTGRYYGMVLPRDTWWLRLGRRFINFFQRVFRNPFQVFIHPVAEVEAILEQHGLHKIFQRDSFIWHVALFAKA
jgi:magnesium-protoporphyrin O-methyltransferase